MGQYDLHTCNEIYFWGVGYHLNSISGPHEKCLSRNSGTPGHSLSLEVISGIWRGYWRFGLLILPLFGSETLGRLWTSLCLTFMIFNGANNTLLLVSLWGWSVRILKPREHRSSPMPLCVLCVHECVWAWKRWLWWGCSDWGNCWKIRGKKGAQPAP